MRRTLLAICVAAAALAVASYSHAETLDQFMSPHQPIVEGSPMSGGSDLFTGYKGYMYRNGSLLIYAESFKDEPDQLCERIQAAEIPGLKLTKVQLNVDGPVDTCNNH